MLAGDNHHPLKASRPGDELIIDALRKIAKPSFLAEAETRGAEKKRRSSRPWTPTESVCELLATPDPIASTQWPKPSSQRSNTLLALRSR